MLDGLGDADAPGVTGAAAAAEVPGPGEADPAGDGSPVADVVGVGCGTGEAPALPVVPGEPDAPGDGEAVPDAAGPQATARNSLRRSPTMRCASSRLAAGRVFDTWDRWYWGRLETGMSVVS